LDWQHTLPIGQLTPSHLPGVASMLEVSLPASVGVTPPVPPVEPPTPPVEPPVPPDDPTVVVVVPAPPVELPPVPLPPLLDTGPALSSPPQALASASDAIVNIPIIQRIFRIAISLVLVQRVNTDGDGHF